MAGEDGGQGGAEIGFVQGAAQGEGEGLVEGAVGFVVEGGGEEDFLLRLGEGDPGGGVGEG